MRSSGPKSKSPADVARLKLEVAQLQEREEARKKMSLLEEEVRTFKASGATKLLQLELSTLRERDAYNRKKLQEAEDEQRNARGAAERRLAEVEGQRSKEIELHEKRIVKLMNVLEALTVAGDAKADVRAKLPDGRDAIALARQVGNDEVVAMLKKHAAPIPSRIGGARRMRGVGGTARLAAAMNVTKASKAAASAP